MMEVQRLSAIRSRCLVSVHSEQLKVVSAKPHSNLESQFTTLISTAWPGQLLSQFKIMLMPCLCPKRLPTLRRRLKEKRKKQRPQKIRLSRNNRKLLVLRYLRRKSVSFHTQSPSHFHLPNLSQLRRRWLRLGVGMLQMSSQTNSQLEHTLPLDMETERVFSLG